MKPIKVNEDKNSSDPTGQLTKNNLLNAAPSGYPVTLSAEQWHDLFQCGKTGTNGKRCKRQAGISGLCTPHYKRASPNLPRR